MAEKKVLSEGNGETAAQSGDAAPSAGAHSFLQDGLTLTPLDSNSNRDVQPFPRSPKLQKKMAGAGHPSPKQLSRRMEEMQVERSKTEAHIKSLKKRMADLSKSTDVMKQQVHERFESMRRILKQDEQAILESLDVDLRRTRAKLDLVVKTWKQHQDQVTKNISSTQTALSKGAAAEDEKGRTGNVSPKKAEASEQEIRLDDERFERLLKSLSSVSKLLKTQLQRKTLLLDSSPTVIDRHTCHNQIMVTPEGRGLSFSDSAHSALERPLQFDKVCCALGCSPVTGGQSYWEVDVRCCSAWAVGVAYASLERKGRDKGTKLGRNRNSWCVELRHGCLSAWHNDRHVPCQSAGQTPPATVGVWVNYDKGQLMFYDADTMATLQKFSAVMMPVFDRAHHQFTEPLYPAVRFLKPPETQMWPNHLEFSHLHT